MFLRRLVLAIAYAAYAATMTHLVASQSVGVDLTDDAGAIRFGALSDVNLYRTAGPALKTDNNLSVAGTIAAAAVASSGTITGGVITASGAISGASLSVGTGTITGGTVTTTGAISGGSLNVGTGAVTSGAITSSGAITGASLNAGSGSITSGAISCSAVTSTGGITGTTLSAGSSGVISGGSLNVGTGAITSGAITSTGTISGTALNAAGAIAGATVAATGAISGGSLNVGSGTVTSGAVSCGAVTSSGTVTGTGLAAGAAGAITGGSLNVGSGSVTAGSVGVSGAVTAASLVASGALQVGTTASTGSAHRFRMLQSAARCETSAAQQITSDTATPIAFLSCSVNTDSMWTNTPTNFANRVFAPVTGLYAIDGYVMWGAGPSATGNIRQLGVQLTPASGGSTSWVTFTSLYVADTSVIGQSVSTMVKLTANDFVQLVATQHTGSTNSLYTGYGTSAVMTMYYIGE